MKTRTGIRNWAVIALIFVGLIYFLLITGKEHTVFLDNRKGESGVRYSLDGEDYKALGTKKIKRSVKGTSHTLYLKTSTGEKYEQEFSLSFRENDIEINVKEVLKDLKK